MSEQKSSKKTILIVSCVLVVLIAAAAIIYAVTRPATHQGAKTVTVKVITGDTEADTKTFTLHTDQEFLRGALEEQKLQNEQTALEGEQTVETAVECECAEKNEAKTEEIKEETDETDEKTKTEAPPTEEGTAPRDEE